MRFLHGRVALLLACGLQLAGCRCSSPLQPVAPARLVVTPTSLTLAPTWVGQRGLGVVAVVNEGGARAEVPVQLDAPFTTDTAQLSLSRGATAAVMVAFAPEQAGHAHGVLRLGDLEVPVDADALEVPACTAIGPCQASDFDFSTGQCLQTPSPDGTACRSFCVSGSCQAGVCVGQFVGCDDGDACTVDACAEATGCTHSKVLCPAPSTLCQVAACDSASGCGVQDAADGTLCGPDDCALAQVQVCIAGQCVARARPGTGRCSNTWVAETLPARWGVAMAYDAARRRVLAYGGRAPVNGSSLAETWEWEGTRWSQRFPAASPPPVSDHAMAWDSLRQVVVLFGGAIYSGAATGASDLTWEWDGVTWLQRTPASSPSARDRHALAYDEGRHRVVLFGGAHYGTLQADTWEWDGRAWVERPTTSGPTARGRHALAYDAARGVTVLFGGEDALGTRLDDTWEWDGARWTLRSPAHAPPGRAGHGLVFDAAAQRVLLFGGSSVGTPFSDTWEWDGADWTPRQPAAVPPARIGHGFAYDVGRRRAVAFGGISGGLPVSDTWEWDGSTWALAGPVQPQDRSFPGLAWDGARQQVLLFGGAGIPTGASAETWAWDGSAWSLRQPASSPPGRTAGAMAWDEARQRVVLFGGVDGHGAALRDTWEWDGSTWAPAAPLDAPPAGSWTMTYEPGGARPVLLATQPDGGLPLSFDTWAWDGGSWAVIAPAAASMALPGGYVALAPAPQGLVFFTGASLTLGSQWLWDGASWASVSPALLPYERGPVAMAFDESRQRTVLFGAGGLLIYAFTPETWEWDGTSWWQRQPTSSPQVPFGGSTTVMAYDAARQRIVLYDGYNLWRLLP